MHGPLFFGSSNDLVDRFAYADDPAHVTIDLSHAQIWDASTVAALDSIETKYRDHGTTVTIDGLDERSTGFHRRLTGALRRLSRRSPAAPRKVVTPSPWKDQVGLRSDHFPRGGRGISGTGGG